MAVAAVGRNNIVLLPPLLYGVPLDVTRTPRTGSRRTTCAFAAEGETEEEAVEADWRWTRPAQLARAMSCWGKRVRQGWRYSF